MSAELTWLHVEGRYTRQVVLRPDPAVILPMPYVVPDLDHGLIEAVLSRIKSKSARAGFWRDHVAVLAAAFIDRGIDEEVVEAVLRDHLVQVRRIHAERMAMPEHTRARERSEINFTEPPEVGATISLHGKIARVVSVEPYVRKRDGAGTFVITWDIEGRIAKSGLRADRAKWAKDHEDA